MPTLARLVLVLSLVALAMTLVVAQAQDQPLLEPAREEPVTLDLPAWSPDPATLPPELQPLDVVRPELPDEVAAEVAELEARIAELEKTGLTAETRAAQDAALDEAIALAERVLALRAEHQGNTPEMVRWRDAQGEPGVWHEVVVARQKAEHLRRLRGLDGAALAELRLLDGTDFKSDWLYGAGQYAKAMAVTERQLDIRRRVLGDEHPDTLTSIAWMGVQLRAQGRLAEAEPYYRQALEGRRRVLGEEHPDTLTSINNSGFLLQAQGRLAEAEPYYRQALEGRRRVLGDEDPDTLVSINNMGFLLQAQGRLVEAEPYYRQALEGRRRVLGEEHPHTLSSINNMGFLLEAQGRLAEAEPYYQRALEGRRRVLTDEHPHTLRSFNNMGSLLQAQGRLAEAEPYYRRALEGRRRELPDEHPDTLQSIHNMGFLLQAQGRLAEAEPYCRQALDGYRRVVGDEHPRTLVAITNIGALLQAQGRLAEAEPYHRQALEVSRRKLGEEHQQTLVSINNMGALLEAQGRLAEAESYYRQALEGFRRVLGEEHSSTLTSMNNMGALLHAQGRLAEAEPYFRQALEGSRCVLGEEHSDTLRSISNIGALLRAQGRLAEAEPYHRQALEGCRRVLGEEHPSTLLSINNMGFLLEVQGRLAEAEPYYRRALEGRRRVLGEEHPETLVPISNMGFVLQSQGRLAEAEPYYREALATAERLRVDVIGGAQERAAFAGRLALPGVAAAYARALIGLDRASEALAVLERGRSRAGLDLMGGGTAEAERVLRELGDADALARYDAALVLENEAKREVFEAEARMATAPDEEKAEWRERVKTARVALAERTAAVFAELRGLVPAADPLDAGEVLAALGPGEALLSYSWTGDGVVALVARDGEVRGVTLAKDKDEAARVSETIETLRERIATRPPTGESVPESVVSAASAVVLPEELRRLVGGATSLTVIADGPLAGVPLEVLLEGTPIAYAPSATIAIDRRRAAQQRTTQLASAVVVGDPAFGSGDRKEPDYPETGALLAMVQEGSNADTAGLRRGDVLLRYGEHTLASAEDLGPAIRSTTQTLGADAGERPVRADIWRDGEVIEVALATGRMGVVRSKALPPEGLRSMAFFDRSADTQAANASSLEQIRLYGGELGPLPATRLEASAVAAMLGAQSTLLLGGDATAPRLRDAVVQRPPRVLHLATHGLLGNTDRPLLASLALTTPEEPSAEDIGFLTLEEILGTWGGSLRNTELVVLSACDTARGVRRGGTTMALPLGFFVCGTETVVASLWKVDDRATALLMARFYANWLGETGSEREIDGERFSPGQVMSKLAALREAKTWLRSLTVADRDRLLGTAADTMAEEASRDPTPRRGRLIQTPDLPARPYDHPYYWAAFVLYGSPL